MTESTRSWVSKAASARLFRTRETVETHTPAALATSMMLTVFVARFMSTVRECDREAYRERYRTVPYLHGSCRLSNTKSSPICSGAGGTCPPCPFVGDSAFDPPVHRLPPGSPPGQGAVGDTPGLSAMAGGCGRPS